MTKSKARFEATWTLKNVPERGSNDLKELVLQALILITMATIRNNFELGTEGHNR